MSQTKVDFSQNPTGPQLMDDYLAKMQENVLTTNSGVTRPEYAKQGTLWIDMSITPWLLKVYDGSQDITLGKIDINNDKFISSNPMTTTGDMIVQGADGNPNRIAPGTEGYVLMSNGAGKLPSYRDVGSEYARVDSVVTLTDNQTISGAKAFAEMVWGGGAPINFIAQNNNIEKGVTPASNQYCGYDFRGKNGDRLAYLGIQYNTSGNKVLDLQKLDTNLTKFNSGFPISTPTPATTESSTIVATTAFVNNKINAQFPVVTALPSSPTAGVFYFVKES